jgi:hypothetical protein
MDPVELVALLREATFHPYQLGFYLPGGAIPPVPDNCVSVSAGPVVFVVESRTLDDEAAGMTNGLEPPDDTAEFFEDRGPTLHVFGAADGVEHLRFDCFEDQPHYHYFRSAEKAQIVRRIDQYAEGDPLQWAIERVRDRLPEMLEQCGQGELAADARANRDLIVGVIEEIERLLHAARDTARATYALGR